MDDKTKNFLRQIDQKADEMRARILCAEDALCVPGTKYFVSADGDDDNDGLSESTPWKSLKKVSDAPLKSGDGVFFKRGDLFRGCVYAKEGVSYGAYGSGEKPRIYGWDYSLAHPLLWESVGDNIYKLKNKILDAGTLVFNHGEKHSRKLIPSFVHGEFVCRDNPEKKFDLKAEMTQNLDLWCRYDERTTTAYSKGENFAVPIMDGESYGDLYLRCDEGNPGEVFDSIEALTRRPGIIVGDKKDVRIDNICLKYIGHHAIAAGGKNVEGLTVTNCEIGWIGGTVQHYNGTDPNFPKGRRGSVTRFGNGVEIYGGCKDYAVENCYIYQVYDAAVTHQITTCGQTFIMENVVYANNLIEECVYSIEYFLDMTDSDEQSYMKNIQMSGNVLRRCGYGWGQQRHNKDTPAHIKGWDYQNVAYDYRIENNVFDRSAYRMVHIVAKEEKHLPVLNGNVYIQNENYLLGQFSSLDDIKIIDFDENASDVIREKLGDKNATVIVL